MPVRQERRNKMSKYRMDDGTVVDTDRANRKFEEGTTLNPMGIP
jgi:hypothetical protein